MQDRRGDEGSSKQRRGHHLPPLAPRDSRPSSTRERTSGASSSTGRPPRLSHRSRAGCWTCRGRKVKCDEQHPRCGPCTRLNRECDWDHRWNFNDATTSTQGKYSNISTAGNAVWDPTVRHRHSSSPVPGELDNLPEFATLTTEEDRETKARTSRPGTYGVVFTPESFAGLAEYQDTSPQGSRRLSGTSSSSRGGHAGSRPGLSRSQTISDPTTVVLDKFEDASPVSTGPFSASATESRRSSFPDALSHLTITTPPYNASIPTGPHTPTVRSDEHLVRRFREYIVPRLVQPQQDSMPGVISQGSTKDVIDMQAARSPSLQHAICAISMLNLANNGAANMDDPGTYYELAVKASQQPTSASPDLLSDGVFLTHFLLLVYDISIPMGIEDGGMSAWKLNLESLKRIALHRGPMTGNEAYAYTLWSICELDVYACLLGSGDCDFLRTMLSNSMIPPFEQQIPSLSATPGASPYLPNEATIFPNILHLNQGILLRTAKIAQTAQTFREEASGSEPIAPETWARWQSTAAQLQSELTTFWQQAYPTHILGPATTTNLPNTTNLPERVRAVFESALMVYHTALLYTRTSLFPRQRTLPSFTREATTLDSESRIKTLLSLAESQITNQPSLTRRTTVFPLFLAGAVSTVSQSKARAVDLMKWFEGKGIGTNTQRTRMLLEVVYEEQRRAASVEDVEWLRVMRERGLGIVNCGL